MADFKTALEALGLGRLSVGALSQQLDKLLQQTPQHALRLLALLDEVYGKGSIDDKAYATLKRQINLYRRTHATETEQGEGASSEATVFAQDDMAEAGEAGEIDRSEEATEVKGGSRAPAAQRADAADSEEATEVRGGRKGPGGDASEDVTAVKGGDATRVMVEEDMPATGTGVDFDISSQSAEAPSSFPPSTGPSGTGFQAPMTSEAAIIEEMGPGSVIKQRFKLLEVLGVGGMGKVYKGIDMLKEEARDKNPYMAIKLLNEDFKSHPEAFIALQRESSRQQKLAHPNIATVYDFDRIGGPGTPVFITMELMEGQPLNNYIKKAVRKTNGLPFPEAFRIVRQLGAALQYAHDRRLVHSDFKPGNAFLCNDGTVKTLDFGIARAVKNPITGEGEKTLFDPGKLGALTPAYASLEMLEGEEPDPRDDIYALGCVAYELLTGKHPYNKLPANTAKENGLVPAPVKGLNKKQNRALRRALAYRREDRSPHVSHFVEEFEGKATWHKNPFTIAAAVLLVIGIGMIPTITDYFHKKGIEKLIAELNAGDNQFVVGKLGEIRAMEEADKTAVTNAAKDPIQRYFASEVARYIDISAENYNFPTAFTVLKVVQELFPGSLFVQEQQNEIDFNKKQKLTDLYNSYIAALDPQNAVQNPTAIDTTKTILETIRKRIDPAHPLLTDPRPSNAYRLAGERALADGNYEQALTFVNSGLLTARDDARLTDLKSKVENAIRVAQMRDELGGVQFAALPDFKQHEQKIIDLSNLSNAQESPVLDTIAGGLKDNMGKELARVTQEGTRADAEALAADYGALLGALQLQQQLTQLKVAHLSGQERTQAIQQIATADRASVQEKLAAPDIQNVQWEAPLLASIRELDSLKTEDKAIAADLQAYRDQIAKLYVDQASSLLKANRFEAAEGFVGRGERFAPEFAMLTDTRNAITQARTEFERQQRVNDLKEQFTIQTEADRVAEAQQVFDQLKAELPEDDTYITRQAPGILAESYARLAERSAEGGDFATALKLAEAGLTLAPRNASLIAIRDDNRVEVNIVDLGKVFQEAQVFTTSEVADMARKVNQIEDGAPTRYPEFRKQSETVLAQRINALAQSDENSAAALADAAIQIFPTSSVLADLKDRFQLEPWPDRNTAEGALQSGELTRANTILQGTQGGQYAQHPEVLAFQKEVEAAVKEANEGYAAYEAAREAAKDDFGALRQAKKLLVRAQSVWVDNPAYDQAETDVDQLIADAPNNPAKRVIARESVDISAASATEIAKAEWKPVSSGRECADNLAGFGRRARAICYDLVNTGWRGPLLVVVPAGGEIGKSFAIGKYELSVGDWSKYCAITGNCKPETNKEKFDDPMTGISLQQAQDYLKWLSERTAKTYRLPTEDEWQYAASVGGKLTPESDEFRQIKGTLNCRVTLGDKVLKGTGTASVKSGSSNNWGLKNFVGNVQEWVTEGDAVTARGGAFSDAISNCDLSTARPQAGGADGSTGFRVVLEEVGQT
ncbi:MAG: SUMF1/EgtB/PvdO family nonheme iron enzyme [Gammaproteobacteria bacterium]|nr:SUMF1/EgtB/PvdO family nonheme iron enzyme [Gammaproteobacteria bacterium]